MTEEKKLKMLTSLVENRNWQYLSVDQVNGTRYLLYTEIYSSKFVEQYYLYLYLQNMSIIWKWVFFLLSRLVGYTVRDKTGLVSYNDEEKKDFFLFTSF